MSKRLCFVLETSGGVEAMDGIMQRFMPNGQFVLNRTEWMGKAPRSCAVTALRTHSQATNKPGVVAWGIEVTYRPKGYISYTGNTRYDGWTAMMLDRSSDPPRYLPREVYDDIEFSDLDFGKFVGEYDLEGVKHVTADEVLKEVMESTSIHGFFIAPHRSRPYKKIRLSSQPTGEVGDGRIHILNINNSTPNLEQVVMDALTKLMCEFIEGKALLTNVGNDDLTFVKLSDALVDCAPNEDGLDSLFDILHLQTPSGFLEDLAKRLRALYLIDVDVVDGEKGGLVLRREST